MKKLLLLMAISLASCSLTVIQAKKHNFIFTTRDVIVDLEQDLLSYSEVIIDGIYTNKTVISKLSEVQTLKLKLIPDNHLINIIKYVKDPKDQTFKPINKKYQPKERFALTYKNKITLFKIKYTENSCRNFMKVGLVTNRYYRPDEIDQ